MEDQVEQVEISSVRYFCECRLKFSCRSKVDFYERATGCDCFELGESLNK